LSGALILACACRKHAASQAGSSANWIGIRFLGETKLPDYWAASCSIFWLRKLRLGKSFQPTFPR
jgi:hypothetical protein